MEYPIIIILVILSIFISIIIGNAFKSIINSVITNAKTYSWNTYADFEISGLELIPFLLSFFGAIGTLSKLVIKIGG